jgi:hypothetical protein
LENTLQNRKHVVFTSVNFNYLGRALALARSVKQNDPTIHFVLLIIEPNFSFSKTTKELLLACDDGNSFDEIKTLNDLDLKDDKKFFSYSVVEMCTAVKGQAVVQLLDRESSEFVTYLDPDLFFYDSLDSIRAEHLKGDVLLTPHLNYAPYTNQSIYNDEVAGAMRHGVFNLGFVSFSNTKNGREIAAWWADRLQISSKADYLNGIFTDQKWWDLSQVYFKGIRVVKDEGWNMAPWNVSERRLTSLNPYSLDSGDSLLFFHFSKFPSEAFNQKIASQSNSVLLDFLIQEYGSIFNQSNNYIKNLMPQIEASQLTLEETFELRPKQKPKIEILLSRFVEVVAKNSFIHNFYSKTKGRKRLARRFYIFITKILYEFEKNSTNLNDLTNITNLDIDVLLVTHKGGGGVGEVIKSRSRTHSGEGKVCAILKPNLAGGLTLRISDVELTLDAGVHLPFLLAHTSQIEIHHVLGMESHLDHFLVRKIDSLFLHDRYLISQTPFADASQYVSTSHDVPGLNSPLNPEFVTSPENWQESTKKLLANSKYVYAPSDYIVQEFNRVFPEIGIEKVSWEPGSQSFQKNESVAKSNRIMVISPTGVHKGSSILIQVAEELRVSKPYLTFSVFGDLEVPVSNALSKMENVVHVGQISRSRLNFALSNSPTALGWIPSLTGESYSLALSDFLSNGLTVVAAKTGAITERLQSIPGHYLYDPSMPVIKLSSFLIALADKESLEDFMPYIVIT